MRSFLAWLAGLFRRTPPPPSPPAPSQWGACIAWVLQQEGGYVDNPSDPGGPTNMGVTQATLSAHLGRQVTAAEVRGMTQETAAAIYFHDYWQANRCGEMPPGVDLVMLDCVVMSGPAHPRRWLQHAVGVAEDGVLGADTMAALSHVDAHQIIQAMTAQRCQYYQSLPMWPYFRNGWDARIQATHLRATGMAAG